MQKITFHGTSTNEIKKKKLIKCRSQNILKNICLDHIWYNPKWNSLSTYFIVWVKSAGAINISEGWFIKD